MSAGGEENPSKVSNQPQEDFLPKEAGSITGSGKEKKISQEKTGAKGVESKSGQVDLSLLGRDQTDGKLSS